MADSRLAEALLSLLLRIRFAGWTVMLTGRRTTTGYTLAGSNTGYVWVRSTSDSWEQTQVRGDAQYVNVPVWVGPNADGQLQIMDIKRDMAAFSLGGGAAGAILPPITPESVANLVFGGNQMRPGRVRLSPLGGLRVYVEPFFYPGGYWPGGDVTLTVPAASGMQSWVGIALNTTTGTMTQLNGGDFPLTVQMSPSDLSLIAIPDGHIPLEALVLKYGQTVITGAEQWEDWRLHYAQGGLTPGAFVAVAPGSSSRNVIQPSGDYKAVVVKNHASQTANPFEAQSSAGAMQTAITPGGGVVVNEQGNDSDSRIEGDTDANLLFVDASTDRVGIGTNTPAVKVDVVGAVSASGNISAGAALSATTSITGASLDINGDGVIRKLLTDASTELTIASGAVTVTQTAHRIDTESNASSDDLDTLSGGADGQLLLLRAEHGSRTVVLKHGTGNILLYASADVFLDELHKMVLLMYVSSLSAWVQVGGIGGGGGGGHTIQDEGSSLTARTNLNFVGSAVAVTDDSANDRTTVTITGGSGTEVHSLCQGRLTLTTGVPVTTSDVTAATTLYFTPYKGNQIGLHTGSSWEVKAFSELSLSLSGYTADKNYDIWAYNNAGTVTLDSTVWTNDTTRATALAVQDGVYIKSGDTTRRYLGTIRITGTTGQTEDSLTKRFVWNLYNQEPRRLKRGDYTSHTYSTAAYRYWNNDSSKYVEIVVGLKSLVNVGLLGDAYGNTARIVMGIDSATNSIETMGFNVGSEAYYGQYDSAYVDVGKHNLYLVEYAGGATCSFHYIAMQVVYLG